MAFTVKNKDLFARLKTQNITRVTRLIRTERHRFAVRRKRELWGVKPSQRHLDHQRDPLAVLHDVVNRGCQLHQPSINHFEL